jgi:hypothetical protein
MRKIRKIRKVKERAEGFQYTKKITKPVLDELLKIRQEKGLTTKEILKKAKNPRSHLHRLFNWDDTDAAERWREHQANLLINEVKVVIEGKLYDGFGSVKVLIPGNGYKSLYEPMPEILSKDNLREQIIQQALKYLETWKMKYEMYKEFEPIVRKINEVRTKLKDGKSKGKGNSRRS